MIGYASSEQPTSLSGHRPCQVRCHSTSWTVVNRSRERANQALEQTRDSVLRYGEVVGCELLNFFVRQQEAQSQSREAPSRVGAAL
jgi:hypothetical protein